MKTTLQTIMKPFWPIIRRLAHSYWWFSRGMTLGVRCACMDENGHYVMVRHGYVDGWQFPGGGVEKGETIMEALRREAREEAGIIFEDDPEFFGFYYNEKTTRRDHVALYLCHAWRQVDNPESSFEIQEIARISPDMAEAELAPSAWRRLQELAGKTAKSPYW